MQNFNFELKLKNFIMLMNGFECKKIYEIKFYFKANLGIDKN